MNRLTQSETNTAETATIPEIRRFRLSLPRWQGGRNVKKKIATLLVTVAMAGALFAGPAWRRITTFITTPTGGASIARRTPTVRPTSMVRAIRIAL